MIPSWARRRRRRKWGRGARFGATAFPIHSSSSTLVHHPRAAAASGAAAWEAAAIPSPQSAQLLLLPRPLELSADEYGISESMDYSSEDYVFAAGGSSNWSSLGVETKQHTLDDAGTTYDEFELMLRCDERVDGEDVNEAEDNGSVDHVSENSSSGASSSHILADGESEETLSCSQLPALVGYEPDDKMDPDEVTNAPGTEAEAHDNAGDNQKDEDLRKKEHNLYALRRNPKRSQRFIDEEFAVELSPCSGSSLPVIPPKSGSISRGNSISSEKARACTECGKEFSSWKALFGHMRCHPEREWRGIQKPVSVHLAKSGGKRNSKKSKSRAHSRSLSFHELEDRVASFFRATLSASDDESDAESIEAAYMNGGGFISNNPAAAAKVITGKRSKRSRTTLTAGGDMKEERDMANCLVMLACAGKNEQDGENEADGTSSSSGTIDMNVGIPPEEVEGLQNSGGLEEQQQNCLLVQRPTVGGHLDGNSPAAILEGAGTRTMFLEDVSGGFAGGELLEHMMRYECSTCKKIFKSHQALGGHRASHKKVKGCFARTNDPGGGHPQQGLEEELVMLTDEEILLRSDEQLDSEQVSHPPPPPAVLPIVSSTTALAPTNCPILGIHQRTIPDLAPFRDDVGPTAAFSFSTSRKLMRAHECSICHRVFTSGQALGGHKRCHWGGTVERVVVSDTLPKPGTGISSVQAPATGAEGISNSKLAVPIRGGEQTITKLPVRPEHSSGKLVLRPVLGGAENTSGKLVIRPVLGHSSSSGSSSKLTSEHHDLGSSSKIPKLTVVFGDRSSKLAGMNYGREQSTGIKVGGGNNNNNFSSYLGDQSSKHAEYGKSSSSKFGDADASHASGRVGRADYDTSGKLNKAAASTGAIGTFNGINGISAQVTSLIADEKLSLL